MAIYAQRRIASGADFTSGRSSKDAEIDASVAEEGMRAARSVHLIR
jgi:hypothetical protein